MAEPGNSGNSTNTDKNGIGVCEQSAAAESVQYNAKVKDTDDIRKEMKRINDILHTKIELSKSVDLEPMMKDGRNTRLMLAGMVMELYELCGKAVDLMDAKDLAESKAPLGESATMDKDIATIIKTQLQALLPAALKEAMTNEKEQSQPEKTSEKIDTHHQLILENKESDTENAKAAWTTVTRKGICQKLKDIPANKFSVTNDGKASIHFPDKESLELAADALSGDYKLTPKSTEEKKLQPKLKILDVSPELLDGARDVVQESIKTSICCKNPQISKLVQDNDGSLKVVYYDIKGEFVVIEVSSEIRQVIRQANDRIYLGLGSHRVRDHFHVIQCYHCQGLGHKAGSRFCKRLEKSSICLHCAGEHQSRQCTTKGQRIKYKCHNCTNSKIKTHRQNAHTHTATDALCPFMIKEKEYMISRTLNSTESKNEYQRRLHHLKELRRHH